MSILIKNIEMPKCCDKCWALDDYGDYPVCRITEEQRGYDFPIREKRMDKCPLVPVPPSVYVRPVKRGKRMYKKITTDLHVVGQCSVCKERRRIDNYCPNCGAHMREEN